MSRSVIKLVIFAGAIGAVFYLVSKARAGGANPDATPGAQFGTNGAFSQDTWQQDFGVQGGW